MVIILYLSIDFVKQAKRGCGRKPGLKKVRKTRVFIRRTSIEGLNRQFRHITKNKPSFTNDDTGFEFVEVGYRLVLSNP